MNYNDRQHFFKYTTSETAKLIVGSRKLRWSSPLLFNDPFDHQTGFAFPFTGKEFSEAFLETSLRVVYGDAPFEPPHQTKYCNMLRIARANRDRWPREKFEADMRAAAAEMAGIFPGLSEELNANLTERLTRSRVLCLTERGDNLVMWSHYANSHRGVAFKFRRLEQLDHRFLIAQPVQYSDEAVSFLGVREYINKLFGLAEHDLVPRIWDLAFRKHADWKYEQEWRVHVALLADNDVGPGYSDDEEPPELFEAIYLGCRMDQACAAELVQLIRERLPQTTIFQAQKRTAGIGLDFVALG
ncbi:DUF2971 domain-containing protein [Paraburkholderia acidipaludis]|uniref:DUF2971 domain-containing protein n=1 Tax=Paraburkholderia acidipaludis TaxID=660537 RepID=UPI0005BA6A7E|nr:DUF2971 domain-containing protein [Paraburkholderia acidipaludis]